jgi:hypothetical protein
VKHVDSIFVFCSLIEFSEEVAKSQEFCEEGRALACASAGRLPAGAIVAPAAALPERGFISRSGVELTTATLNPDVIDSLWRRFLERPPCGCSVPFSEQAFRKTLNIQRFPQKCVDDSPVSPCSKNRTNDLKDHAFPVKVWQKPGGAVPP